ncbi:MAG TPA: acetyl-CoA carboxylase biotin carboxylase subunit, partial [bacterium]|nr:acetyl-CoA carboxylase biotin carboxylase subunit [bacterium]
MKSNQKLFNRILIANRGEVAWRIINACKELNIETAAVFSEADQHSPHLQQADFKICIGPGPSSQSYLSREAILQAAINTECQALHPGFGFLAEDSLFSYMCEQNKLTFIGPGSNSIRLMGNKSRAKLTMKDVGLPTIPGSDGNLKDIEHAVSIAAELGYPVLLKATAGGGGKGIRPCRTENELRELFPQAKMEAEKAFGDAALYLEKLILKGRHIEFQILADSYGNVIHLG